MDVNCYYEDGLGMSLALESCTKEEDPEEGGSMMHAISIAVVLILAAVMF